MGQAQMQGITIGNASENLPSDTEQQSSSSSRFVLFEAIPKDVFVHSLRFLPSHDHCKLARTCIRFADGSKTARSLYKGLRINSLQQSSTRMDTLTRTRSGSFTDHTKRAVLSVIGAFVGGSDSGNSSENQNNDNFTPPRLFKRSNPNTSENRSGGITRAAICALARGTFKNLRMLSFPIDFDVRTYNLSYHEVASIFCGCPNLKLVSSLPGGVLSFVSNPLPALREVSIASGTPLDLHSLFRNAPELTWLSFSPILSSACEGLLGEIPHNLPKLKTLELIRIRLTRHPLWQNIRQLEDLEMLSLQQVQIDDIDLRALSEKGHSSLEVLVILGNPEVTYEGLKIAHDHLENLKVLDVRDSLNRS